MNRPLSFVMAAAVCCLVALPALAVDSSWNYAVELGASVQSSPTRITLSWKQDSNGSPDSYTIYRKAPASDNWGSPMAVLGGGATSYTDGSATAGVAYEYQ